MSVISPRRRRFVSLLVIGLLGACAQDQATAPGDERWLVGPVPASTDDGGSDGSLPDLGSAPAVSRLLRIALKRNPAILAARERALAAGEGAAIEGWLPNPQVMIGWYETSAETRVGPQRWSLGLRQAIPFPTKLRTKARIEDSEAARMRVVFERVARDVLVDVVRTGHEIAYIDEAVEITGQIEALLERYTAAAAAQETGSLVSELFRADTQRAQLANDRVILVELRFVEAQHLKSLLDLSPRTVVGTPRTGPVPPVAASFPELLDLAERHSQELREAGIVMETAGLRASLAEQRRLPDFTVGVTTILTDELDPSLGMNPRGNGDDPLILQLGATLPIWVEKDAAAIRRARAMQRAAALQRAGAVQSTRDRVARAWFQVGNAQRLHRLYAEVLVPRAATAARTAEDLLASGKGSLGGVLETIAVFHNFRLAAARARADHGRAVAALERAVGTPFAVEPETVESEEPVETVETVETEESPETKEDGR